MLHNAHLCFLNAVTKAFCLATTTFSEELVQPSKLFAKIWNTKIKFNKNKNCVKF